MTKLIPTGPVVVPVRPQRKPRCTRKAAWWNCDREANNRANMPEDDALQSDLQAKVNELFGGRQNVTIDMNTDSEVQFTVNRNGRSGRAVVEPSVDRFRWYVFTSLVVVSVVTGAFFTALYYSGAVHGLDPTDDRHYEMPSYGSGSYIDPYELLQHDREFQDSKSQ